MALDEVDTRILALLQQNARISNAEIARQVKMAGSAVLERIRKLEQRGAIEGYRVKLNPRSLGAGLLAFILVRTEDTSAATRTGPKLAKLAEVQEVHHVAGEDCFLLKVRTSDTDALGKLLREKIGALPSVNSTRTTIVLETLKESGDVPLPENRHE